VAKRQNSDREVLTSLPRSRPVRRSAKRGERTPATEPAETVTKAPAARARKPAVAVAAKPATASPKKPAAARAKKPASTSAPRAAKPAAPAAEPPRTPPRRKVPAAGYAAPSSRADAPPASAGAELVSTAIQAAGELAQIGLTVGRQTLQSMLDRLPKP
jgi:hypothetical protein